MFNLLFIQSLKKKSRILTFLIVCCLLISENALARIGEYYCTVWGPSSTNDKFIKISLKFFEYEPTHGVTNSYLKSFEVKYSTRDSANLIHLLSASTENQTSKSEAWIKFKEKNIHEIISLHPGEWAQGSFSLQLWKEGSSPILVTDVCPVSKTKAWCGIVWFPEKIRTDVIFIVIRAKWYNYVNKRIEVITTHHVITPFKAM